LLEDTVRSAARFAVICGRKTVTPEDTMIALKYEAHEFFVREGLETRFFAALAENERFDDSTSSEYSDSESEEEGEDEEFTTQFQKGSLADQIFHAQVLKYHSEWTTWQPEDEMIACVKRAVDAADTHVNSF
jgi:hypothetical protein